MSVYTFPVLLCFCHLLGDVKITRLQFNPQHAWLGCFKIKASLTCFPHLSQNVTHRFPACSPSFLIWQRALLQLEILFFGHLLVIPVEALLLPQRHNLALSWQLIVKPLDPNLWICGKNFPCKILWSHMAHNTLVFTWKIPSPLNTVRLPKFRALTPAGQGEAHVSWRTFLNLFASATLVLLLCSLSLNIHVIEFCFH